MNAGASKWYGGMANSLDGLSLSEDTINASAGNGKQTFTFRSVAGAAVSFKDFNQFRLFDTQSNTLIAVANIPMNILSSGATSGPSAGSSAGSSATPTVSSAYPKSTKISSASPSASSGSNAIVVSASGWLSLLLLAVGL